jgi:hypothetical protein
LAEAVVEADPAVLAEWAAKPALLGRD